MVLVLLYFLYYSGVKKQHRPTEHLKGSVCANSDVEKFHIANPPFFVQQKVEFVTADLERDERRGLLPVSMAGYLRQRHGKASCLTRPQGRLRGHRHHTATLVENHTTDGSPGKQNAKRDYSSTCVGREK